MTKKTQLIDEPTILHGDCLTLLKTLDDQSVDSLVTDPPAGISFMGKEWDGDKGGSEQWTNWMESVMRECLRVLKPGAHGLVWSLPRTSHWTTWACERAGFEIRDVITHLFGTGFPKSLDVSKAIDKAAGAQREVTGAKIRLGDKKAYANNNDDALFNPGENRNVTAPATDDAKKWAGFGTALKPAAEFWVLIRKPLSEKTVAANIVKWGTGALNIDASRIEHSGTENMDAIQSRTTIQGGKFGGGIKGKVNEAPIQTYKSSGRFPANLILSHSEDCSDTQCVLECAIQALDEQSGHLIPAGNKRDKLKPSPGGYGSTITGQKNPNYHNDQGGGASRFFYCAKVSPSERGKENNHPTVKAQKLMRYLSKLITPPGGIILDPFMGSGSTGLAAKTEGFKFIGIEREQEYLEIAKKRISHGKA